MNFLDKAHSGLLDEYKLLESAFRSSDSEHGARINRMAREVKHSQNMLDRALELQQNMVSMKVGLIQTRNETISWQLRGKKKPFVCKSHQVNLRLLMTFRILRS